MNSNNDELDEIKNLLNDDEKRVRKLEDNLNGFKNKNDNNQPVTPTVPPTVPPLDLQNISQDNRPLSKTTSSSSRSSVNDKNYDEQHKKEIRKARYNFLVKNPNERKPDTDHVKEFQDLTKEFSNPSSGSSTQRSRSSDNNTSRVLKSYTSRGGRRRTRKTKRRGTKKNSKYHKKRRSLKKRH